MFAPAVSNAGQPLIYGLGWYSQVYDDERLIWHSGGWSPSVSALYLKVPDENLTFILLANNYNLTRPYPFDAGDVLYSTPALAFYKKFVLPRQSGKAAPSIDWSAGEEALVTRLNEITDGDMRAILERELWSNRKLYASVGEDQQAERLVRVHRLVFSDFSLSRVNPVATNANSATPQPQTVSLLPAQVSVLSQLLFVWLILTLLSLLVLIVHWRQRATVSRAYFVVWFPITMLFGLLGLAAYLLCDGRLSVRQRAGAAISPWLMALRPALFNATGNMAGLFLALLAIYFYFPDVQQGAVPAVASMFLVNWLVFQAPLAAGIQRQSYLSAIRDTLPGVVASTVFILLGALPVMIALTEGLFLHVSPDSPLFLLIVQTAAIAGSITVTPYTVWLLRRDGNRKVQAAAALGGE
jgi:hypothetical protein